MFGMRKHENALNTLYPCPKARNMSARSGLWKPEKY